MKYLLVLLVVVVGAWIFVSRRRGPGGKPPLSESAPQQDVGDQHQGAPKALPANIIACVHCGLHLPQPEAQVDAQGRFFCTEAHRLAGPR
jgi:uncharacterized protein